MVLEKTGQILFFVKEPGRFFFPEALTRLFPLPLFFPRQSGGPLPCPGREPIFSPFVRNQRFFFWRECLNRPAIGSPLDPVRGSGTVPPTAVNIVFLEAWRPKALLSLHSFFPFLLLSFVPFVICCPGLMKGLLFGSFPAIRLPFRSHSFPLFFFAQRFAYAPRFLRSFFSPLLTAPFPGPLGRAFFPPPAIFSLSPLCKHFRLVLRFFFLLLSSLVIVFILSSNSLFLASTTNPSSPRGTALRLLLLPQSI